LNKCQIANKYAAKSNDSFTHENDLLVTKFRIMAGIEHQIVFKDHLILLNKTKLYFANLSLYLKSYFERDVSAMLTMSSLFYHITYMLCV